MPYMINYRALFVVILLSLVLPSGCSGLLGEDPGEQANQAIKNANASISEHNRLFDEARTTYTDAKQQIESGDAPSQEKDRITKAKNSLEEARQKLKDAREHLSTVDDLDVDPAVKEYARLLSDAMDAQLAAEAKRYSSTASSKRTLPSKTTARGPLTCSPTSAPATRTQKNPTRKPRTWPTPTPTSSGRNREGFSSQQGLR